MSVDVNFHVNEREGIAVEVDRKTCGPETILIRVSRYNDKGVLYASSGSVTFFLSPAALEVFKQALDNDTTAQEAQALGMLEVPEGVGLSTADPATTFIDASPKMTASLEHVE